MKPGSRCIVDLVTVARAVPHRGGRALETLIEWHLVDPRDGRWAARLWHQSACRRAARCTDTVLTLLNRYRDNAPDRELRIVDHITSHRR